MVTQLAYFRDKIHITVILPCPDLTDLLLFFNITRFTKTLSNKKSENEILTARQESRELYFIYRFIMPTKQISKIFSNESWNILQILNGIEARKEQLNFWKQNYRYILLRPATVGTCATDGIRDALERLGAWLYWIHGAGPASLRLYYKKPSLAQVTRGPRREVKSHFPRFTVARPILGIPFLDCS